MKRRLFNIAVALSLLLTLVSAAAWAMSHAGSPAWRLIGTAHSADLTRVSGEERPLVFTTTPDWSNADNHGFWDAWWTLSRSGQLSLLAQVIDYEGTLRQVSASPPRLAVDLPGESRAQAVVFGRAPELGRWTRLGFAWHSDAQQAGGDSARGYILTFPYWFFVMVGVPLPLLWLRARRRAADTIK